VPITAAAIRERLLGAPLWLAVASLAGLALGLGLYRYAVWSSLPEYRLGKSAIAARARQYAEAHGLPIEGSLVLSTERIRNQVRSKLSAELLRSASADGTLPIAMWSAVASGTAPPGRAAISTMRLTENGEVVSVHLSGEHSEERPTTRADSHATALAGLGLFGLTVDGYIEQSDYADPERTEGTNVRVSTGNSGVRVEVDDHHEAESIGLSNQHKFVWRRPHPDLEGLSETLTLTVEDGEVRGFDREIVVDTPVVAGEVSKAIEVMAFVLFVMVASVGLFALALLRLVTRDFVSYWRTVAVTLLFLAAVTVSGVVSADYRETGLAGTIAMNLFLGLFIAVPLFCAWFAGEADAYHAWGRRCTEGMLALLSRRPYAQEAAREYLEGTLWGAAVFGALVATAAIVVALFGAGEVTRTPAARVLDASPAWAFPAVMLPTVLGAAIVGPLCINALLRLLLKRPWLSTPVAGTITALLITAMSVIDLRFFGLSGLATWAVPVGIGLCILAERRGILTVIVALLVLACLYSGAPALAIGGVADRLGALLGFVLLAAPAAVAVLVGRRLPAAVVRDAPPPRSTRVFEQARQMEELNIAQRAQKGLLPSRAPAVAGFEVAGTCIPASEVGGDYYDYFDLADGRLGVAVGDVAGKGIPAAFVMTLTKGFMEVATADSSGPVEALGRANRHLRATIARNTFVTMVYATFDSEARSMRFARAGHSPPILLRAGGETELLTPAGTPLGALPAESYAETLEAHDIQLGRGDVVVMYTDGITEAMNRDRQEYGEVRLLSTLRRIGARVSPLALVEALVDDVREFTAGAPVHDDITVVAVKST
jgi:hypothetical protein